MRIEQRQCLLGILPGKLFLSIGQVSICEIVMGVGRIGISQQVELEDLDRIFYVARALIILSDDVHGNFRPQLRPRIFASGFEQLLPHLCRSAGYL